jgi:arsenate reductase
MAEGFAKHHGSDVLVAESAGMVPAGFVAEETVRSMAAKNIDISSHHSKPLCRDETEGFDLIVNMSGLDLPDGVHAATVDWQVPDPIGKSENVYARVRDQIETLVMSLILDLRRQSADGL